MSDQTRTGVWRTLARDAIGVHLVVGRGGGQRTLCGRLPGRPVVPGEFDPTEICEKCERERLSRLAAATYLLRPLNQ